MQTKLRKRIQVKEFETSRTDQSFKNEVNINTIVKRLQNGQMPNQKIGSYGDVSEISHLTLGDALNRVVLAQQAFESLPVQAKQLIGNDWTRYEELAENHNQEKLNKLGLVTDNTPQNTPPVSQRTEPRPPKANDHNESKEGQTSKQTSAE